MKCVEQRRAYMKGGLLPERIGLPDSVQEKQAADVLSTGFTKAEITELCAISEVRELRLGCADGRRHSGCAMRSP